MDKPIDVVNLLYKGDDDYEGVLQVGYFVYSREDIDGVPGADGVNGVPDALIRAYRDKGRISDLNPLTVEWQKWGWSGMQIATEKIMLVSEFEKYGDPKADLRDREIAMDKDALIDEQKKEIARLKDELDKITPATMTTLPYAVDEIEFKHLRWQTLQDKLNKRYAQNYRKDEIVRGDGVVLIIWRLIDTDVLSKPLFDSETMFATEPQRNLRSAANDRRQQIDTRLRTIYAENMQDNFEETPIRKLGRGNVQ